MTRTKPNLLKLAEGKWINPAFITLVEDSRNFEDWAGHRVGSVHFGTPGYSVSIYCNSEDDNKTADDALKIVGVS